MAKMHVKLTVNGKPVEALAEPRTLLIHFLREELGADRPAHRLRHHAIAAPAPSISTASSVKSCTVFVAQANGGEVTTIEGIAGADGSLHPLAGDVPRASRAAVRLLHARA